MFGHGNYGTDLRNRNFLFTGIDLGDGKLRHPVALYEIVFLLGLIFLFYKLEKVDFINGDRFKLFFLLYFLYRFFIEFLKPYESLFFQLSIIHFISIFVFFTIIVL
ncbi:prolipoprotein diacylglyceryl transferase family protein [Flavobacterium davisii]|uniref:prolipoprotein diacylglyceryl transferase family protein n=1 Tax=Flavobacterium davisii TaxID=2906077 RepID=UPI002164A38A|nr:prolipoprotein diacylglyceryl transferase family protein [Flavobacterium davisii]